MPEGKNPLQMTWCKTQILACYPDKPLAAGAGHLKRQRQQTGSHLLTTQLWTHLNWRPSGRGTRSQNLCQDGQDIPSLSSAEECVTQEQQKLNPKEPSSSSSGLCPPGRSGHLCRLFTCTVTYRGQRAAGQEGSAHPGWRQEGKAPCMRPPEVPAHPQSESRGCAAAATSHSPELAWLMWPTPPAAAPQLQLLHHPRQVPSTPHQVLQPQLSRLPISAVCPSSPPALGAATQPPNLSPVPKTVTTASCHHHHHQVFAPPGQVCTPQQTLPGQPAATPQTTTETLKFISQRPSCSRFGEQQFYIRHEESWFAQALQLRPQPHKNL